MNISGSDLQAVESLVRKYALLNATKHNGKANIQSVMGKILTERADLRSKAADLAATVASVVKDVNSLEYRDQVRELNQYNLITKVERVKDSKILPPLPNVDDYDRIVTRFSPNPDCVLHLGSIRAIILSHDYAQMYNGKFLLRFEDTDPRLKKSSLKFYDTIKEDLKWLGCQWNEEYNQSDRIPIYYKHVMILIENDSAYICTCSKDLFISRISDGKSCSCRDQSVKEHVTRWQKMISGVYKEGDAVVRIKTDLKHPNPAIRDWPAFRIIDPEINPHPRVGSRYRVWPLYNFAAGIDDHLTRVTHIIRGKEHYTNTIRQKYLYEHMGWRYPETIHYGRLKIIGAELSKSKILKQVSEGLVKDFDDPRLATLIAIKRRGITPECLRKIVYDVGPRPVDATLSWENIYAYNRKIVDEKSNRYFYVEDPIILKVIGVMREHISMPPVHPNRPSKKRMIAVKPENGVARLLVSKSDKGLLTRNRVLRLMELFNIKVISTDESCDAEFHSESYEEARKLKAPLIHWLPLDQCIKTEIIKPNAEIRRGLSEPTILNETEGNIIQLIRYGFVRLDLVSPSFIRLYYSHH